MILFFFLLLMLALAWGVVDHFQSLVRREPPPAPPPARIAAPAQAVPAPRPPDRPLSGGVYETADGDKATDVSPAATTMTATPAPGDSDATPTPAPAEKP